MVGLAKARPNNIMGTIKHTLFLMKACYGLMMLHCYMPIILCRFPEVLFIAMAIVDTHGIASVRSYLWLVLLVAALYNTYFHSVVQLGEGLGRL